MRVEGSPGLVAGGLGIREKLAHLRWQLGSSGLGAGWGMALCLGLFHRPHVGVAGLCREGGGGQMDASLPWAGSWAQGGCSGRPCQAALRPGLDRKEGP